MPQQYTVRDNQSGRTVTFRWNAPEPPTEADMAEVFTAAGNQTPPSPEPEAPMRGMLPTAGGLLGSLVGTVAGPIGRVAGAGVGGALGKGAEMLMDDTDQGFMEGARAMGAEALKQGGMEAAGGVVGKGLKAIAPKIAGVALAPAKAIAQKYPNVGQTYVREGKLFSGLRGGVGTVGKRESAEQAKVLRQQSKKASDAYVAFADSDAGAPQIAGRKVISELRPLMQEAGDLARTGKTDSRPLIAARAKSFARQNPKMTATDATGLRRRLDTAADKAFVAEQRMGTPAPLEARIDQALAQGLRKQVRAAAPKAQPDTTRTMDLVGLEKSLRDASTRKHLLTRNIGVATGLGGGLAGALGTGGDPTASVASGVGTLGAAYMLTNPRNLGRIALASHGAGRAIEISPQLIRAAILAQLAAEPNR